jgi:hypothetical protein
MWRLWGLAHSGLQPQGQSPWSGGLALEASKFFLFEMAGKRLIFNFPYRDYSKHAACSFDAVQCKK